MKTKTSKSQTKAADVEALATAITNMSGYEGGEANAYERGIIVGYERVLLDNKKAVNMHDEWVSETDNIKFYASQALKSLDNNTLSEVRGLLEGILEKSEQLLKQSEGK